MTVEQKLANLREQWKWANPQRKRTIELLAKALKLKYGIKDKEKVVSVKDVKDALF